jgi:hypothetical protein
MIKSASFTTSVRSADAVTFSPSFTPATITETHSYEMAHCCGDILSQLHPCNNHQDTQLSNGTLLYKQALYITSLTSAMCCSRPAPHTARHTQLCVTNKL